MKRLRVLCLALTCALGASCEGGSLQVPRIDSGLLVYVHWDDLGLAQKRLEILELEMERFTDETGIAEFLILLINPAGARASQYERLAPVR